MVGGLALMFFSTGATLGTNLNMLVLFARLERLPQQDSPPIQIASSRPATLPERSPAHPQRPRTIPEETSRRT
jgi:hypothetical protein